MERRDKKDRKYYPTLPIFGIFAALLLVGILVIVVTDIFRYDQKTGSWQEDFFGREISAETEHTPTEQEKETGEMIAQRLKDTIEYSGDEESAPNVGQLGRFYYFPHYKETASCDSEVQLKTALIDGDSGSVWVTYTYHRYDKTGELISGSSNILCRLTIEKNSSGDWTVTKVSEPA